MNGPALYEPSAPASWRIALPHSAAAVPVARALVRTALAEIEHAADSDTAELLTAELVANAVEHTTGDMPIELVVELLPNGCQVEVHDPD
ncbi:ATP-binding protein, partial [Streptomyces sp. HC44]